MNYPNGCFQVTETSDLNTNGVQEDPIIDQLSTNSISSNSSSSQTCSNGQPNFDLEFHGDWSTKLALINVESPHEIEKSKAVDSLYQEEITLDSQAQILRDELKRLEERRLKLSIKVRLSKPTLFIWIFVFIFLCVEI